MEWVSGTVVALATSLEQYRSFMPGKQEQTETNAGILSFAQNDDLKIRARAKK
jgi:hypothetical protein